MPKRRPLRATRKPMRKFVMAPRTAKMKSEDDAIDPTTGRSFSENTRAQNMRKQRRYPNRSKSR